MRRATCIGLISLVTHACVANNITGHTFFSDLPRWRSGTPLRETFFRNDRIELSADHCMSAFQAAFYGSGSTDSNDLARFFMPFNKVTLNVREQESPVTTDNNQDLQPSKDIDASHFNIRTVTQHFNSQLQLRPEQSIFGIGFDWKQGVWRDCTGAVRLYAELSFPIERVENRIKVREVIVDDGGGSDGERGLDGAIHVASMTEGLKQCTWKYGRIDGCKKLTAWGVGDVELKMGWISYISDRTMTDSYIGLVVPTGTKIDAKQARYVFTPVIGNNHHWGLIYGTYIKFDVWEHGCHEIKLLNSIASRILFKNFQVRSFDLEDKQWSRYMEMYRTQSEALIAADTLNNASGTSGINIMTQCVKVDPRYIIDVGSAFRYTNCAFLLEVGYNMTARHSEEIYLKCWQEQAVLKAFDGLGNSSLARTVRRNFTQAEEDPDEYADSLIYFDDINLDSAAHPALIGNMLYGSMGYEWTNCRVPTVIALGASYEFSSINAVIDRWTVWGRIGISF